MAAITYEEKLRHPKWQRQRLKVFERDNWKCTECGDSERTLHVHHIKYIMGREPWDYPKSNFKTLCELCHSKKHKKEAEKISVMTEVHPLIYTAVSHTVQDLTAWLNNSYDSGSISDPFDFIREYKCAVKSPASDEVIIISALSEVANNIATELKEEKDYNKQVLLIKRVMAIRNLRMRLSTEFSISPAFTTIIKTYLKPNG